MPPCPCRFLPCNLSRLVPPTRPLICVVCIVCHIPPHLSCPCHQKSKFATNFIWRMCCFRRRLRNLPVCRLLGKPGTIQETGPLYPSTRVLLFEPVSMPSIVWLILIHWMSLGDSQELSVCVSCDSLCFCYRCTVWREMQKCESRDEFLCTNR